MPSQYTMPNGQEVTPAQFASLGRVITAALGLDLSGLSDYRVIWLMKRVERTAVGKFDITSSGDAYLMKSAISEHLAEAAQQVDFPISAMTTWDDLAVLGHNTWSWGCKVPTAQRANGDGLDAYARCPICEPDAA